MIGAYGRDNSHASQLPSHDMMCQLSWQMIFKSNYANLGTNLIESNILEHHQKLMRSRVELEATINGGPE